MLYFDCFRLLSCIVLVLAASWSNAGPVSILPTLPNQLVNVIEQLSDERFHFSFNEQNNAAETFVSVCTDGKKHFGVVPFNNDDSLCWLYDSETEQLTSTEQYKVVFEASDDLNQYAKIFLEHQPDVNIGIWITEPNALCYSPASNGTELSRNYYLKSGDATPGTMPAPKNDHAEEALGYTTLAVVILFIIGFFVLTERKTQLCQNYWCEM